MIVDFVVVCDRPYDMSANVSLIVECLQSSPDTAIAIFHQFRLVVCVHLILIRIGIDPLFHLDKSSSIVHFVCDICRLGADASNLANEGDLGDV